MSDTKFQFGKLKQAVKVLKDQLPIQLANASQNYFVDAFAKQSFDGKAWKDVKRHDTNTKEYKYPIALRARKLSSPILIGVYKGRSGGDLRRQVGRSIRQVSFSKIVLQVDLKYAKAQFEGTDRIPARPNLRQSKELTVIQRQLIERAMSKALKPE